MLTLTPTPGHCFPWTTVTHQIMKRKGRPRTATYNGFKFEIYSLHRASHWGTMIVVDTEYKKLSYPNRVCTSVSPLSIYMQLQQTVDKVARRKLYTAIRKKSGTSLYLTITLAICIALSLFADRPNVWRESRHGWVEASPVGPCRRWTSERGHFEHQAYLWLLLSKWQRLDDSTVNIVTLVNVRVSVFFRFEDKRTTNKSVLVCYLHVYFYLYSYVCVFYVYIFVRFFLWT